MIIVSLNASWLLALLFVVLRFSIVIVFSPIVAFRWLPGSFRFLLLIALSVALLVSLPKLAYLSSFGKANLALAAVTELFNGFLLALGFYIAFSILMITGHLLDVQIGFNAASIFNPALNTSDSLIGTLLTLLATLIFFQMGGARLLLQGFASFLRLFPPGQGGGFVSLVVISRQMAQMFVLSLSLAMPIMFASAAIVGYTPAAPK